MWCWNDPVRRPFGNRKIRICGMPPMRAVLLALLLTPLLVLAGASENAPKGTFAESFLDFPDEVRDAAKARVQVAQAQSHASAFAQSLAGIDAETINSRAALARLPVVRKGELLERQKALRAQDIDPAETIDAIEKSCNANGGSGPIPAEAKRQLQSISKILNIGWIADGSEKDATIICPRSSSCPRAKASRCAARSSSAPRACC